MAFRPDQGDSAHWLNSAGVCFMELSQWQQYTSADFGLENINPIDGTWKSLKAGSVLVFVDASDKVTYVAKVCLGAWTHQEPIKINVSCKPMFHA